MADKTTEKRKISKAKLRTIIVASISIVIGLVLVITNFFVPVKYLTSYMVLRNKGAAEGTMRVRFVDVGYGNCTIIELPDGKNMLIDAGDGRIAHEARILKYLNKCNIGTIDYLICTSVNSEHCGGLSDILSYKKVNKAYVPYCTNSFITDEYYNFMLRLRSSTVSAAICEYGEGEENADYGYFFKFLSPSVHNYEGGEYEELNNNPSSVTARNNASAVMWLQYGETSFLFTSDAGSEILSGLYLFTAPDDRVNLTECKIIQVANHGGASSASSEFYAYINAEVAVISVGDNAYSSPSLEVISDIKNCEIYRTDVDGTITIEVTGNGYNVV